MVSSLIIQFFSFDTVQLAPQAIYLNPVQFNFVYFCSNQIFSEDTNIRSIDDFQKYEIKTQNQPNKMAFKGIQVEQKKVLDHSYPNRGQSQTDKRIEQTQQQYSPTETKKGKKKGKKPYQSAMRNILPNIIHQIFCFIQKQKRSGEVVKKYIEKIPEQMGQHFNIDRFYRYQRLVKQKRNHYMNMKGLSELNRFQQPKCQVYNQEQQKSFVRMNRILLKYFLEHQFMSVVLTSSRMSSQARLWNLSTKRRILTEITQTFSEC